MKWTSKTYYIFLCVCVRARARTWTCARVASIIHHAMRRHIDICGLSGSTIFFHQISQTTWFSGRKLLNIKCVFRFLVQLLFETFLILRIIQRDIVINVKTSSCKVPVVLPRFSCKLNLLDTFSGGEKNSNIKFHKNPSSGSRVVPRGRTDIRSVILAFRSLRTRIKMYLKPPQITYFYLSKILRSWVTWIISFLRRRWRINVTYPKDKTSSITLSAKRVRRINIRGQSRSRQPACALSEVLLLRD